MDGAERYDEICQLACRMMDVVDGKKTEPVVTMMAAALVVALLTAKNPDAKDRAEVLQQMFDFMKKETEIHKDTMSELARKVLVKPRQQ